MVAKPIVEYLLDNGFSVNLASRTVSKSEEIIKNHPNGKAIALKVADKEALIALIKDADLTVSLLPYKFHVEVAKICLEYGKPMVTTSYVKKEMQDLDEQARGKGVILLNEIGLDPGIDHMSAMRIIDAVKGKGGKIEKFYSLCGALPAPEAADNPFKYKFSWSPRGVILASKNDALYLKDGEQVAINPKDLFKDIFPFTFKGLSDFIVYPNRDSISYIDIYGLEGISTIYRGTFRYKGWCESLDAMKTLDLLSDKDDNYSGMKYSDLIRNSIKKSEGSLQEQTASYLGIDVDAIAIQSLEWLGLFNDTRIPDNYRTAFDIIADLMLSKMMLGKNERDIIALQHLFLACYEDGSREVISSRMVDYGTPATDTSISRTVALPAAIAVKLILEKKITITGVHRPVKKEIYEPVLDELETMGIKMEEEFGLPESEMIS